jgi:hypothetical protein
MRAWLKVLSDRHPNVTWVPVSHQEVTTLGAEDRNNVARLDELARSA